MERVVSHGLLALPTITLSFAGALIALRWRRIGVAVMLMSSIRLFAASTPGLSSVLLRYIEAGLSRTAEFRGAQAIVVLAGEVRLGDGAEIPDRLGRRALERLLLATEAHRQLRLLVALNGGPTEGSATSEGALTKAALETKFGVPAAWNEDRFNTTWVNAAHTARLLRPARVSGVALIPMPWRLPRALWAFDKAALKALPWPVARTTSRLSRIATQPLVWVPIGR
jgi:uncharacterized SAM-binding protein YcdF (DUF218 family)